MKRHFVLRRAAVSGAIAAAGFLALLPAQAQVPGSALAVGTNAIQPAACNVTLDQVRFDLPLVHTARVLAAGKRLKIVALGSSSITAICNPASATRSRPFGRTPMRTCWPIPAPPT